MRCYFLELESTPCVAGILFVENWKHRAEEKCVYKIIRTDSNGFHYTSDALIGDLRVVRIFDA